MSDLRTSFSSGRRLSRRSICAVIADVDVVYVVYRVEEVYVISHYRRPENKTGHTE